MGKTDLEEADPDLVVVVVVRGLALHLAAVAALHAVAALGLAHAVTAKTNPVAALYRQRIRSQLLAPGPGLAHGLAHLKKKMGTRIAAAVEAEAEVVAVMKMAKMMTKLIFKVLHISVISFKSNYLTSPSILYS